MHMLRSDGTFTTLTTRTDLAEPKLPAHVKKIARDANEALNNGVREFNKTVLFARGQNRDIGWFPPKLNEQTGQLFDWGPKPTIPTPLAALYELPEWAR